MEQECQLTLRRKCYRRGMGRQRLIISNTNNCNRIGRPFSIHMYLSAFVLFLNSTATKAPPPPLPLLFSFASRLGRFPPSPGGLLEEFLLAAVPSGNDVRVHKDVGSWDVRRFTKLLDLVADCSVNTMKNASRGIVRNIV